MGTPDRIIFDLDAYDADWWRSICTEYQEQGEGYWMAYDPEEMDYYTAHDIAEEDLEAEVSALADFLDGSLECIDGSPNACAGNRLLVRGSAGLWDGTHSGFTPYDDLMIALDTSSSRFGGRNIMADCKIDKVWEEGGSLFVTGYHHDGRTTIEIRQLTDAGQAALEAVEDAWAGEPFTAGGAEYDGSSDSVNKAIADIWENEDMTPRLNYLERAYGTGLSREELERASGASREAEVSLDSVEAGARAASEVGLDANAAVEPPRKER